MQETRIPIGKYVIRADSGGGWVYGKPSSRWDKDREKDVDVVSEPRYTATLSRALSGVAELTLHESAAQSLKEVREILDELHRMIVEIYEI